MRNKILNLRLSLFLLLSLASRPVIATTYDFVLTGRLAEASGKPVEGPVALEVKFYHVATGGTAALSVTSGLESVALTDGVFHIKLSLDAFDYQTVFPGVTQSTYFEVTDLTNAPNSPYERSQVAMLPYASKIPFDPKVFKFDSDGKMTLYAAPEAGKYLKGNADGTVSWDSPGSATSAETYTNKIINADNNTITNISDTNIKAAAAISDSKLATISTAGKVSGAAITSGTIAGSTAVSTTGTIATTGKVGVGAAAGTSQLEVKGGGATSATSSLNVMDSAGSSKLYVRDDGNVGIGTTNPISKVHVLADSTAIAATPKTGSALVLSGGSAVALEMLTNDGTAAIHFERVGGSSNGGRLEYRRSANSLGLFTDGAERLTVNASGNIGIGATSPSDKLHVGDGTAASAISIQGLTTTGDQAYINFKRADGTTVQRISSVNSGATAGLHFYTNGSSNDRLAILDGGNVGIGTMSPSEKLDVNGTALIRNKLKLYSGGGQNTGEMSFGTSENHSFGSTGTGAGTPGFYWTDRNADSATSIGGRYNATNLATAGAKIFQWMAASVEKAFIDVTGGAYFAGNVGIGTTSPGARLDIKASDVGEAKRVGYTASSTNFAGLGVSDKTNYGLTVYSDGSPVAGFYRYNGGLVIGDTYAANYISTMPTGGAVIQGNVGIGTTSPGEKLHVNGKLRVDTLAAAAATTVCIDGSNTLSSCSSSIRYKDHVERLNLGLDSVLKMRPVTFKWKNRNEFDLGFIAEDMHEISPLLNNYRDGKIEGV